MNKINKYVINFSDIPSELVKDHWLSLYNQPHSFVEVHLTNNETDELSNWFRKTYPRLFKQVSFLIKI